MYEEIGEVSLEVIEKLKEKLESAQWKPLPVGDLTAATWMCRDVGLELPIPRPWYRCFFVKIDAKGHINEHVDRSAYQTYHFPVTTNDGCVCSAEKDGERHDFVLEVGKYYRIDRNVPHWSVNDGDEDRVHLLVEA